MSGMISFAAKYRSQLKMVNMTAMILSTMAKGIPKLTKEYGIDTIPPPIIVDKIASTPVKVVRPCSPTKETL